MSLTLDLAEYVLGFLAPHDLPDVCLRALEEGHDSQSLAAGAGTPAALYDISETQTLWDAALRELGLVLPRVEEAAELIVDDAARRAARGELTPDRAVARIVDAYYASGAASRDQKVVGDSMDLGEVVGIYWRYTDLGQPWSPPEEQLDREALEALRGIVERRDAKRPKGS